jgi:outer membrane protein OmpA-like peptidoglycan-associated protein
VAFVGRSLSVDALARELGGAQPKAVQVAAVLSVPVVLASLADCVARPVGAGWLDVRLSSVDADEVESYADLARRRGRSDIGEGVLAMVLGNGREGAALALAGRVGLSPSTADQVLVATARSVMTVLAKRCRQRIDRSSLVRALHEERLQLHDAGWGPWIEAAAGGEPSQWLAPPDHPPTDHPATSSPANGNGVADGAVFADWAPVGNGAANGAVFDDWVRDGDGVADHGVADDDVGEALASYGLARSGLARSGLARHGDGPAPRGGAELMVVEPVGDRPAWPIVVGLALMAIAAIVAASVVAYRYLAGDDGEMALMMAGPTEARPSAVDPAPLDEAGYTTSTSDTRPPGTPSTAELYAGQPGAEGAFVVIEAGTLTLAGEVPDQETADELLASFSDIDLGPTRLVDELQIVESAPPPSGRIVVDEAILFGFDSAQLTDPDSTVFHDLAMIFVARPSWTMTVVGHTDSMGAHDYNMDLSLRRASAVRDALVAAGVSPAALAVDGAGDTEPVAPNDTVEGRALNRRIEIIVSSG